jgi:hypothetical protein
VPSSRSKRVSVSDSNEDMKHSQCSTSDAISDDGSICEADEIAAALNSIPKLTHHGSLSSDEADLEMNDTAQGPSGAKGRSSKPKWVPLPLPENARPRRKPINERSQSEGDKKRDKENSSPGKEGESGKEMNFQFYRRFMHLSKYTCILYFYRNWRFKTRLLQWWPKTRASDARTGWRP